jgi:tRNA A37 methylthiotransferase MiaB
MNDDVPQAEKMERLHAVEELEESVAAQINAGLVDSIQEVLIEGQKGGRLHGRSRANKIVHFSGHAQIGDVARVRIEKSSAWSLQGRQEGPTGAAVNDEEV